MAENKKSIVVYADWINKFEELTDDEAGKLIKHFFRYVNDLNPEAPDRTTKLLFIDIENSLKRDLKKWEKRAERSRENGSLGGRPPKDKNLEEPEETQQVILKPKKPDSDSVSVTDSVSDILLKKETKDNDKIEWGVLLEYFNNVTGKKCKVVNEKTKRQLNARLKEGYTKTDIANAIKNCMKSSWHIEDNFKTLTLEFISRADKLEKYCQTELYVNTSETTQIKKYDN